jgi:hypothetical protein
MRIGRLRRDHHIRTGLCTAQRHRRTDAPAGAGYEDGAGFHIAHASSPLILGFGDFFLDLVRRRHDCIRIHTAALALLQPFGVARRQPGASSDDAQLGYPCYVPL